MRLSEDLATHNLQLLSDPHPQVPESKSVFVFMEVKKEILKVKLFYIFVWFRNKVKIIFTVMIKWIQCDNSIF